MLTFVLFIASVTLYKIAKIIQCGSDFGDEIYTTIYFLLMVCDKIIQIEPNYI
jgi:hypothetical protein